MHCKSLLKLKVIFRDYFYLRYLAREYKISCKKCKDLMIKDKTNVDLTDPSIALTANKDRGELVYPSSWLVKLVNVIEKGLRLINDDDTAKLRSEKHLLALVRAAMGVPPEAHLQHSVDTQDGIRNHVAYLIEAVVIKFHQASIHEISTRINNHPTIQKYYTKIKQSSFVQKSVNHSIGQSFVSILGVINLFSLA